MRPTWIYFLLLLGFFSGICLDAYSQLPHFTEHPLPVDTETLCFHQDNEGMIWLGTQVGLARFDGLNWRFFPRPGDSMKVAVTTIGEDSWGQLWVGYEDGGICRLASGKLTWFEPEEGLPVVAITGIVHSPDSTLWFATYGEGVYYYRNQRLYNINTDDGLTADDIYAMALSPDGKVCLGTDLGINVCMLKKGEKHITHIRSKQGLPDEIVRALYADTEGSLWIGTHDMGVCKYDWNTQKILPIREDNSWQHGPVNALSKVGNSIWIGTENQGAFILENETLSPLSSPIPGRIHALSLDQEGNMWVAGNSHEVFTAHIRFAFFDTPGGNIQSIHCGKNGTIWFSTPQGLYTKNIGLSSPKKILNEYSLNIVSLYEDALGYLWIGTFDKGVWRLDPKSERVKQYAEAQGLVNSNVLSIDGNDKEIWFATLGGAARCTLVPFDVKPVFSQYNRNEGLGIDYIYQVHMDQHGRVWFATDGDGVNLWENGQFRNFPELESEAIYTLSEGKNGEVWVSTDNDQLFKFSGNQFEPWSSGPSQQAKSIRSLAVDSLDNLLIIHQKGISLQRGTQQEAWFGQEVGIEEIDPDLNAVDTDNDGNIWIGSQQGVIRYTPIGNHYSLNPRLRIDHLRVFLEDIPIDPSHPFRHNENHLTFNYQGLWYQAPKQVQFRHRLLGHDIDWRYSQNPVATYPELPPGTYTFELQASNREFFPEQKSLTYSFQIKQPFWTTWWFITLAVIFVFGLMYLAIRSRESRLKKVEHLKKENLAFQFETLRTQINPHFLFNSFNTLIAVIENDPQMAVAYVERMSDFFRNMLEFREKSLISLSDELEILESYYFLLKKRYQKNIVLDLKIGDEEKNQQIPPLTLQLLLENACKHNVISEDQPLHIHIQTFPDGLVMSNSLQPKRNPVPSTKFGLQNLRQRYSLLTNKTMKVESNDTDFNVYVPLLEPPES